MPATRSRSGRLRGSSRDRCPRERIPILRARPVLLNDVRGFVFDVDGTLVHRAGAEVRPLPGASEVLDAIRASKRPFALFTNGSHMPPAAFARELREVGLSVEDG